MMNDFREVVKPGEIRYELPRINTQENLPVVVQFKLSKCARRRVCALSNPLGIFAQEAASPRAGGVVTT
jgi:hypothetical protein